MFCDVIVPTINISDYQRNTKSLSVLWHYVAREMTKTAHEQQDFTPAARARLTYSP